MAGQCVAALGIVILGCATAHGPAARPHSPDVEAGAPLESMPAVVGRKNPGDVSLRFAWPLPVDGRCATIARRIEGSGTQVVRTASTLRARADGDQVLIDTVDTQVPADAPVGVLPLAETWPAERLVDAQGRLLRVQPLDADANAAERALITMRLAQRWQSMVSAWAGRSLPLDATYSATAPEQTPEGPVRLQIAIRADGRVPCEAGSKQASCVRLRILSQPTASDVPAVARMAARELLSKDAYALYEPSRVRAFASQTTVVLVTDPDTLLPRRVTERRTLQLRIDPLIGGDGVDLNRQDEVTTACAWQRG